MSSRIPALPRRRFHLLLRQVQEELGGPDARPNAEIGRWFGLEQAHVSQLLHAGKAKTYATLETIEAAREHWAQLPGKGARIADAFFTDETLTDPHFREFVIDKSATVTPSIMRTPAAASVVAALRAAAHAQPHETGALADLFETYPNPTARELEVALAAYRAGRAASRLSEPKSRAAQPELERANRRRSDAQGELAKQKHLRIPRRSDPPPFNPRDPKHRSKVAPK